MIFQALEIMGVPVSRLKMDICMLLPMMMFTGIR